MTALTRTLALIGLFGLVIWSMATVVDVLMRWAFAFPLPGLSDIGELISVFMVAATFPAALYNRKHVTVRFLAPLLPHSLREAVELFGHLLTLLFFVIIDVELIRYCIDLYQSGETTWVLSIPKWPSWTVTTVLLLLCLPIQLVILAGQWRRLAAAYRGRLSEQTSRDSAEP